MPDIGEVWDRATELHHYTDWVGLLGICSSNTIRATHYTELNDSSEIEHFRKKLTSFVSLRVKREIIERKKHSQGLAMKVTKGGGASRIAAVNTKRAMDSLYNVTFQGIKGPPYCDPFITSFCNHFRDDNYERENGLLSQWVGYGGEERYALVFDTRKLWKALQPDIDHFAYASGVFEEVVYNTETLDFGEKYDDLIGAVAAQVNNLIARDKDNFRLDDVYRKFTESAACFKHRAFQEEREVRIFSAPHTKEMEIHLRKMQPAAFEPFDRELKIIHPHTDQQKKHILLFEAQACPPLPIKRIIVGPGTDQGEWEKKAISMVKNKVLVKCSETPYLG